MYLKQLVQNGILNFKPGLVGGHCIGVDPYYLTYKSEQCGYLPELVLAGRRINSNMANWIIERLILYMGKNSIQINKTNLLILGFTFKEDCRDIRNTQVINLYKKAKEYSINTYIVDPLCDTSLAKTIYNVDVYKSLEDLSEIKFDSLIVAVAHSNFKDWNKEKWESIIIKMELYMTLKNIVPREIVSLRL